MAVRKFVEVKWWDIRSDATWRGLDKLPRPVNCTSRGWVVAEDKETLTLAGTIGHKADDDPDDEELVGEIIVLPRGCIKSVKAIR